MSTAENKIGVLSGWTLPRFGKVLPLFLIFLYFLVSSGELLHIVVAIFKPKPTQFMAVLLLGYLCLVYRRIILPRSVLYPSLWLLFSLVISALLSAHPMRSFVYVSVYIFNFVFYFLIPVNLLRFFEPQKILKIYFLTFFCLGLYAVFQLVLSLFGIYDPLATQRVGWIARGQAWTYEPSYYALYMTAYVMFRNAMQIFSPKAGLSLKSIMKILGINCFLLASTSTGVIFSYPAFCIISLWLAFLRPIRCMARYARQRVLKFIAICCALGGVMAWIFWDIFILSFFKFFYFGFMTHGSFLARWNGLVVSFKLFLQYPFFGVGVGGVGPYLFAKNSFYDISPITLEEVESYDPTNVSTEILASLGMAGLIGFLALAFVFYKSFRKVLAHPQIAEQDKIISIALFISLILVMIVLQFNQGLFRPYVWIHAGVTYGYLVSMLNRANQQLLKI